MQCVSRKAGSTPDWLSTSRRLRAPLFRLSKERYESWRRSALEFGPGLVQARMENRRDVGRLGVGYRSSDKSNRKSGSGARCARSNRVCADGQREDRGEHRIGRCSGQPRYDHAHQPFRTYVRAHARKRRRAHVALRQSEQQPILFAAGKSDQDAGATWHVHRRPFELNDKARDARAGPDPFARGCECQTPRQALRAGRFPQPADAASLSVLRHNAA